MSHSDSLDCPCVIVFVLLCVCSGVSELAELPSGCLFCPKYLRVVSFKSEDYLMQPQQAR